MLRILKLVDTLTLTDVYSESRVDFHKYEVVALLLVEYLRHAAQYRCFGIRCDTAVLPSTLAETEPLFVFIMIILTILACEVRPQLEYGLKLLLCTPETNYLSVEADWDELHDQNRPQDSRIPFLAFPASHHRMAQSNPMYILHHQRPWLKPVLRSRRSDQALFEHS